MWYQQTQMAFDGLVHAMIEAPVLCLPNIEEEMCA